MRVAYHSYIIIIIIIITNFSTFFDYEKSGMICPILILTIVVSKWKVLIKLPPRLTHEIIRKKRLSFNLTQKKLKLVLELLRNE